MSEVPGMMKNFHALRAARLRFGVLPRDLEEGLEYIEHPDDVEILMDDMKHCRTVEDLANLVKWLEGRQSGRIDATRDAVYTVLGIREDQNADEIEERAFHSTDLDELEELLVLATRTAPMSMAMSLN